MKPRFRPQNLVARFQLRIPYFENLQLQVRLRTFITGNNRQNGSLLIDLDSFTVIQEPGKVKLNFYCYLHFFKSFGIVRLSWIETQANSASRPGRNIPGIENHRQKFWRPQRVYCATLVIQWILNHYRKNARCLLCYCMRPLDNTWRVEGEQIRASWLATRVNQIIFVIFYEMWRVCLWRVLLKFWWTEWTVIYVSK